MNFRDIGIVLDAGVTGPFEAHGDEVNVGVGYSIIVNISQFEREVLLFRDELVAMLEQIDGKYPPACREKPGK